MTLQHEKVVKGSLRNQNMKKKKLLAAMSSFEVSLKSMESTLYSLPDTCEAGKKTTIALNQSLRWRYFPWVGMRPALSRREMQDYFTFPLDCTEAYECQNFGHRDCSGLDQ